MVKKEIENKSVNFIMVSVNPFTLTESLEYTARLRDIKLSLDIKMNGHTHCIICNPDFSTLTKKQHSHAFNCPINSIDRLIKDMGKSLRKRKKK